MVRTGLCCVMPAAMFNLLAAGSVLAVTPGHQVGLLLACRKKQHCFHGLPWQERGWQKVDRCYPPQLRGLARSAWD